MAISAIEQTNMQEHELLIEAATDFGNFGKTDKICPRCGNNITYIEIDSSYIVRCATDGCIDACFRGI